MLYILSNAILCILDKIYFEGLTILSKVYKMMAHQLSY